jgi:tartrate-resistant acid phosphatase type 5
MLIQLNKRAFVLLFILASMMTGASTHLPASTAASKVGVNHAASALITSATIRFAVIGDYGDGSQEERDVANLVKSWNPDFVITTGDNNYPNGAATTIDAHIGQFYHSFIYPYQGTYGSGATANRFFPTLGNNDWDTLNAKPYLDYFTLPGNERYYDYVWGPVHFFVIDSADREPDRNTSSSVQAAWLHNRLQASTSPWNLVYFHHPAYTSGSVGIASNMQWPYAAWGADAVLSGHSHTYERIFRDGIVYFVNGLGGDSIQSFSSPISGSQVRYNRDYGAMLVTANASSIEFQFISRTGALIDSYSLGKVQSFEDVPPSHWAWDYIERLYSASVTSGCSISLYCPSGTVTRDQMAVFLLKAKHGSSYVPPAARGIFADVPTSYWAADWIERLAAEGITSGCNVNPKQYCPASPVTRDQMAVFLLRAKHGASYVPPSATGIFQDVPANYWAAPWIEQLTREGVTAGCSTSPMLYCPGTAVTRDQMAVFLVRNFSLP